eukprot:2559139-Rhodomonas_salina.3
MMYVSCPISVDVYGWLIGALLSSGAEPSKHRPLTTHGQFPESHAQCGTHFSQKRTETVTAATS